MASKLLNQGLGAAKAAKQDEFYTQYIDIQKEVEAYFEFDSDVLTDESRRLIPTILTTVKDRGAREVTIVGHTDSMGDKPDNFALGLKRAATVRDLLLAAGLDKSLVDVTSLGESDPLVPTANGKAEPQNRRVEIVVYPRQQ